MNIAINESTRLTSDALNVIIQRKHIVDPTKSPAFDPTKHSTEKRVEWRDVSYHSKVEAALAHLIEQKAWDSEATTLSELLAEIRSFKREMNVLIDGE